MNDWSITAKTEPYKNAIAATESLEEPAVGFVKPLEVAPKATTALLKQNNTIIQLLVKISEELLDCKKAIENIQKAIADKPLLRLLQKSLNL